VELTDEACRVAYAACIRPWLIMAGVGLVGLASALVVTCAMCCCNKPVSDFEVGWAGVGEGVNACVGRDACGGVLRPLCF
jgi:hypothetical protein